MNCQGVTYILIIIIIIILFVHSVLGGYDSKVNYMRYVVNYRSNLYVVAFTLF